MPNTYPTFQKIIEEPHNYPFYQTLVLIPDNSPTNQIITPDIGIVSL
jgi:hypothetical protein